MTRYASQDSEQTLAEGLAEYYAVHPDLHDSRLDSDEARVFFRCHDIAHVIFGCGTSLNDEAMVKIYSLFGTTGGVGILRGYRLHESQEIYGTLGLVEIIKTALASLHLAPRVMVRCLRMRRRWPWNDFDRYLDVDLKSLREEHRVRVAH